MYLKDMTIIQNQLLNALQAALQEVMDLIAVLPDHNFVQHGEWI
jgi:hypothetical protein